jgi:hypothetical protein
MALQFDQLVNSMTAAGQGLAGTIWTDIQAYAVPELQKIATQIVAIQAGISTSPPQYTLDGAKSLLDMQTRASIGVIVSMTILTLVAAQAAINQILDAVKVMVNAAVGFALIS